MELLDRDDARLAGAYNYVNSGVVLTNPGTIDFDKFAIVNQQCLRNTMIACNCGELGALAVSLGKGYWEHHLDMQGNIP
jgi:hypothetical protein